MTDRQSIAKLGEPDPELVAVCLCCPSQPEEQLTHHTTAPQGEPIAKGRLV